MIFDGGGGGRIGFDSENNSEHFSDTFQTKPAQLSTDKRFPDLSTPPEKDKASTQVL